MTQRFSTGSHDHLGVAQHTATPGLAQALSITDSAERLKQLLACSAAGGQDCFEALYDELAPLIYTLAFRMLANQAHAEEVTQEIFLEVWQKAPLYNPDKGSVKGWVCTITHRRAVDRVRSTQAAYQRDLVEGAKHFSESYQPIDQVLEASGNRQWVGGAIEQLPEGQAQVVYLAYFRGMTQQQIADHLNIPVGTVKSRMKQALNNLRCILGGTA